MEDGKKGINSYERSAVLQQVEVKPQLKGISCDVPVTPKVDLASQYLHTGSENRAVIHQLCGPAVPGQLDNSSTSSV